MAGCGNPVDTSSLVLSFLSPRLACCPVRCVKWLVDNAPCHWIIPLSTGFPRWLGTEIADVCRVFIGSFLVVDNQVAAYITTTFK